MDAAAERNLGFGYGAKTHIRSELSRRSERVQGQKNPSPKGFAENRAATSLFLAYRSMKDMLARHASSARGFGRNGGIQSFPTGC